MQTIDTLKKKIHTAEDLHSLVKTMKTLAAVNFRHYEKTVDNLVEFHQTIEVGLQAALKGKKGQWTKEKPAPESHLGVIVVGSDQGLCGQFNEHIASYFHSHMKDLSLKPKDIKILCVGSRVVTRMEDAGYNPETVYSLPGGKSGIVSLIQQLLMKMESWKQKESVSRFLIFYNKPGRGETFLPSQNRLLPLDEEWILSLIEKPWATRSLPIYFMDWSSLFSSLIGQHLFVLIFRAIAESLMSENASRLIAMQVAEKNIEEHLEKLTHQFQDMRQTLITDELLEIVAGFEAMTQKRGL